MLHLAGGHRHRLDDAGDAALEAVRELLLGGLALSLGALLDLTALAVGARFRRDGGLRLGRLHRRRFEQLLQLVGERDQHAGLDQQDDGMQDDAAEITGSGSSFSTSMPEN